MRSAWRIEEVFDLDAQSRRLGLGRFGSIRRVFDCASALICIVHQNNSSRHKAPPLNLLRLSLALQLVSGSKKGQRTLAIQIARAAGLKLFCAFSPSEKRFAFLRRPQITLEAFSMMGEAFTSRDISHEKNPSRKFYSQNLRQYDFCLRNLDHQETAANIFPKNQISSDASQLLLAQRVHRVLIFPLEEPLSAVPPGNRKRRRSFRDLEDRSCAAYFMRHHQKGLAVWAVLFLDEEKSFRRDVIGGRVQVLNKCRAKGIRHVINHYAPGPLKPDEGISPAESLTEYYAFRFRALVVAPRVKSGSRAVGIERCWNLCGGY